MTTKAAPRGIAAVYVRISKDRHKGTEAEGQGVANQEAECRPLCERAGYPADRVRIYSDNDKSGYNGKPRPEWKQMLADIAAGEVTLVTTWHPDRLDRRGLEGFIDVVEKAGIPVDTARAGHIDLTTPSGRMSARVVGAVARYESEHKADRSKLKHAQLAADGEDAGGGRPYGYDKDRLTIIESEAEVIRECARRVLSGESLRGVAADLNRRGIPAAKGGVWHNHPVRSLLMSARISGRREHGRYRESATTAQIESNTTTKTAVLAPITADAVWEGIISAEDSDELRQLLNDPARRLTTWTGERTYLLKGLIHCGQCDALLISRPDHGTKAYTCAVSHNGVGSYVKAEAVEREVAERLIGNVDGGTFDAMLRESDGGAATAARETVLRLERERDALAAEHASGEITYSEWKGMRSTLNGRIDEAQRLYDDVRGSRAVSALPSPLAPAWEAMPFADKRKALIGLISAVTIGPAVRGRRGFDPDRVSVRWAV